MPTANVKSRGYQKIADAARAFHFDFRNKTVLDLGSSTGGFTEFALSHGATKVIAVEKGTNQMQASLRLDPRLELHEKTDLFTLRHLPTPDIILADVSFVSLTRVLDHAAAYFAGPNTVFLVMCKPQFEAGPHELTRGVIKNSAIRRQVLKNFESWLKSHHFLILNKRDNLLAGKSGNYERFYLLKKAG